MNEQVRKLATEITTQLADQGRVIEGGWEGLRLIWGLDKTSEVQQSEMRSAFYAGAQHLFGSIATVLEGGAEATERDLERISKIYDELKQWEQRGRA